MSRLSRAKDQIVCRHRHRSYVRLIIRKKWTDFVESFGIPYPGLKPRKNYWTREIVLEEIRRWKEESHPTHYKAMGRDYGALLEQGTKVFRILGRRPRRGRRQRRTATLAFWGS